MLSHVLRQASSPPTRAHHYLRHDTARHRKTSYPWILLPLFHPLILCIVKFPKSTPSRRSQQQALCVRHVARPHQPVCALPLQYTSTSRGRSLRAWPCILLTCIEFSYISYRQSYAHHPTQRNKYVGSNISGSNAFSAAYSSSSYAAEDRRGLLSSGGFDDDGDAVIEMDLLPPRWADVSDEITELLADVATNGHNLEKLHQQHVLPGFNDDEAKKTQETQIERLTQQITKAFHDCQRKIQRVEQMVRESKESGTLTKAEETMARNIQISLATRVQEASASFRKKQSAYLKSRPGRTLSKDSIVG